MYITLEKCLKISTDYNECEPSDLHIQDCGTGATCSNEEGTYSCQCDTGYEGTAPNCTSMYEKNKKTPPLFLSIEFLVLFSREPYLRTLCLYMSWCVYTFKLIKKISDL